MKMNSITNMFLLNPVQSHLFPYTLKHAHTHTILPQNHIPNFHLQFHLRSPLFLSHSVTHPLAPGETRILRRGAGGVGTSERVLTRIARGRRHKWGAKVLAGAHTHTTGVHVAGAAVEWHLSEPLIRRSQVPARRQAHPKNVKARRWRVYQSTCTYVYVYVYTEWRCWSPITWREISLHTLRGWPADALISWVVRTRCRIGIPWGDWSVIFFCGRKGKGSFRKVRFFCWEFWRFV